MDSHGALTASVENLSMLTSVLLDWNIAISSLVVAVVD